MQVIVEKAEKKPCPGYRQEKVPCTSGFNSWSVCVCCPQKNQTNCFLFVKNTLPPTDAIMSAIYEESKDEDGFLYLTYTVENTFGFP